MPWETPNTPNGGIVTQTLDGGACLIQLSASLRPASDSAEARAIRERARQLSVGGFIDAVRRRVAENADLADRYRRLRAEADQAEVTVRRLDLEREKLERTKAAKEFFAAPDIGARLAAANKRLDELHSQRQEQTAALDALRQALAEARERAVTQVESIARSEVGGIGQRLHTYRASLFALRSGDTTVADFLSELAAVHEAQHLAGRTDALVADARLILDEPAAATTTAAAKAAA